MNLKVGLNGEKGAFFVRYRGEITIDDYSKVTDWVIEIPSDQRQLILADMSGIRVTSLDRKPEQPWTKESR
ncbi:hypothetical protein GF338_09750 [candidate division WOR-3 bacterium]|nr:hypothetical protein [candidate division WOR-3 bacterium]